MLTTAAVDRLVWTARLTEVSLPAAMNTPRLLTAGNSAGSCTSSFHPVKNSESAENIPRFWSASGVTLV